MRLKKLNSEKLVWCNITKYRIDWDTKSCSRPQTLMKQFLRQYWRGCIVAEEFVIPGSRLRCDFINFNKKICVEISGRQHLEFNKFMHRTRGGYLRSMQRDGQKAIWCESNGIKLLEVYETDFPLTREWFFEKFAVNI